MTDFWNSLSIQKRNLLTCICFVLVSLIVWRFSVRPTVALYQANQQMEELGKDSERLFVDYSKIKAEWRSLDSLLEVKNSEGSFDSYLILQLEKARQEVKVEVKSYQVSSEDQHQDKVEFVVGGSFHECLKLLAFMERETFFGSIEEVSFEVQKDRRSQSRELNLRLLIVKPSDT